MTGLQRPQPSGARVFQFPAFERRTLANGLNVIVAPMPRLPVVTALLLLDGGAMCEPRGAEGVADVAVRSLMEGTIRLSADDLVQALEVLGTSISVSADWETTILRMTVMAPGLAEALELMSETVTTPRFDQQSFERIRSERLSEIIQTKSEPRLLADEMFSAFLYDEESRYSLPAGGDETSVASLGIEDVRAYHANNYRPDNTTLVLAGDVSAGEAERLAGGVFSEWRSSGAGSRVTRPTKARESGGRVHVVARSGAQQTELRMGHLGATRSAPFYFETVVMNAVLGGLFSSRINLNLREVHGYTYGASSYFDWRRADGPFVISTAIQTEVTGAAVAEVLSEIDRIRTDEISEDELTLATSYLAGVFPIRYETTDAVASGLANLTIFNLPEDYFTSYRKNISAVTTEGVRAAAVRKLQPELMSIVAVGSPSLIEPQLSSLSLGTIEVHGSE